MKMKKIRLGIVGLGHRGRYMFAQAAHAFNFVEPAAACDVDRNLWFESQWNDKPLYEEFPETEFYEDFETMLEQARLDLLLVETGADVHAEFCVRGLGAGLNVMTNIPLVANLAEADMLWKAEQKSKGRIFVGANTCEWGFVNAMVDLYKRGLLGKPYFMEAEYIHSCSGLERKRLLEHSPWRRTLVPILYCTHSLGPLLKLIGEDLRFVSCFGTGGKHFPPDPDFPDYEQDEMMSAQFRTESGVIVRILRNGECAAKIGHHSYRVFGTKGYFERIAERGKTPAVVRFNSRVLYGADELTELPVDMAAKEYSGIEGGHGGADYALFDKMFRELRNEETGLAYSLRDGLRMTLPGIYAAESAVRKGETMIIRYPWDADWRIEF